MTTKERIMQFLDYRSSSKTIFFRKTGIKRGFLDADKMGWAVSDKHLAAITKAYPELSIEWLVTGEGEMLKPSTVMPSDMVSLERYEDKVEECVHLKMELETLKKNIH